MHSDRSTLMTLSNIGSDLTSVTILGKTIVTVHTYEKAVELLDKKGRFYSSRPILQLLSLGGWTEHVVTLPYGPALRDCRRMMRAEINHLKVGQFHDDQKENVKRLLRQLLKTPEKFYDHVEW